MRNNKITSFAGKWMQLEVIMLSEIIKLKRPNITCSHSFVEPRPKMMMMMVVGVAMMMGHECICGTVWGG
jgi:hypothetical protein